ncbi:hypothetical protein TNCV_3079481 [Trichonephila clavipes]|nr:hypothetical protein TNCV_3079481 [Trichonephila clavipes]
MKLTSGRMATSTNKTAEFGVKLTHKCMSKHRYIQKKTDCLIGKLSTGAWIGSGVELPCANDPRSFEVASKDFSICKRLKEVLVIDLLSGISSKGSPIRKGLGERARISAGSLECGTRGLELMHASIWHNRVDSSSKLRRCPLQVLIRCLLANLIEDSQRPPKFGA